MIALLLGVLLTLIYLFFHRRLFRLPSWVVLAKVGSDRERRALIDE
jgi:hypothetical protein